MRLVLEFHRDQAGVEGGAPPDLILALQAEQARNHALVEHVRQAQQALAEHNELLRTRTIERDHAREDAHLWSLCLAHLVNEGEVTSLPAADVNAMEGQMLSAEVQDGIVHLFVRDRPQESEEGRAG